MTLSSLRNRSPRARAQGFTLVELLTVMVIVAILAGVAMPSLTTALAAQELRAAGTDLVSSLWMARSEAIKRKARVQLVPLVAGDWKSGWRVATVDDDAQVDKKDALSTRISIATAPDAVVYERNGRLSAAANAEIEFRDSASHPGVQPRCVLVDPSGMPRLTIGGCQ